MQIGHFNLKDKILIVAEVGNNHEGRFDVAQELVRQAAHCGVDAVKFQTFKTEYFVSRSDVTRFDQLKSFELSYAQFEALARLARSFGLLFISTPFDLQSAAFLEGHVDAYKIASGDNNFYTLLSRVAITGKPLIISSGLSDFEQIARTVTFVKGKWARHNIKGQLAILHCVAGYPVEPKQANLRTIQFLMEKLDCVIGYSDHTVGLDAALMAVALGARIIEKHFTLDKHLSNFRDHQLSADPIEMKELVHRVKVVSSMLGVPAKTIQRTEEAAVQTLRRSIVANADLPQGHRITWTNLTWLRPAGGLSPGEEHRLVGKILNRDVHFGEPLQTSDVE